MDWSFAIVVIAFVFVAVLISDLIGNMLAFGSKQVNALATAVIAAAITFGLAVAYASVQRIGVPHILNFVYIGVMVFIADLIGNNIVFGQGNRVTNALTTAAVAAILVTIGLVLWDQRNYVGF